MHATDASRPPCSHATTQREQPRQPEACVRWGGERELFLQDFKGMGGGAAAAPKVKKQKPNDPCACGSGKKAKKCCATA
jgi:hypothetical protein